MANYTHTTEAGTSRRRAKQIIINNPVQKSFDGELFTHQQPSVTFIMEDRIVMADGSEILIPAGQFDLLLNERTLSKIYPSIDVETGEVDEGKARYGAQIMAMIIDGFEDVFITEGRLRDEPVPDIVDDETDLGSPSTEEPADPPVPVEPEEGVSSGAGAQGE